MIKIIQYLYHKNRIDFNQYFIFFRPVTAVRGAPKKNAPARYAPERFWKLGRKESNSHVQIQSLLSYH